MLKHQYYYAAPVAAVQITRDNLAEVAEWCGGEIVQIANKQGRQIDVVKVPHLGPSTKNPHAYLGMYITRRVTVTKEKEVKVSYGIFGAGYFEANYFPDPVEAIDKTWEKWRGDLIEN